MLPSAGSLPSHPVALPSSSSMRQPRVVRKADSEVGMVCDVAILSTAVAICLWRPFRSLLRMRSVLLVCPPGSTGAAQKIKLRQRRWESVLTFEGIFLYIWVTYR